MSACKSLMLAVAICVALVGAVQRPRIQLYAPGYKPDARDTEGCGSYAWHGPHVGVCIPGRHVGARRRSYGRNKESGSR